MIHLRFVEQKSVREIAEELGRSEGTVKQLQLRAIENLRAQMESPMAELELVEQLDQAIESLLAGTGPAVSGDGELPVLTQTATGLCDLPSEDFKKRLKTELQRR